MVLPTIVRVVAAGRPVRLVWENEAGGLTFEVGTRNGGDLDGCFVKWAPRESGLRLGAEATRLRWAVAFTPVPRVLDLGGDHVGDWLVTTPLRGDSAVSERWRADPAAAVAAIGAGLRTLHDTLPVAHCPFSWSAGERIERARLGAATGERFADPAVWHAEHRALGPDAFDLLDAVPPVDRLVVCHGDACAPNTLIDTAGRWSGHVDLAALGVADRWADLAVATWSTEWNYGPGFEPVLLDAYGVDPDPTRTAFYRLLWDLTP
jgi:aminoglycoside phosphotransferase